MDVVEDDEGTREHRETLQVRFTAKRSDTFLVWGAEQQRNTQEIRQHSVEHRLSRSTFKYDTLLHGQDTEHKEQAEGGRHLLGKS